MKNLNEMRKIRTGIEGLIAQIQNDQRSIMGRASSEGRDLNVNEQARLDVSHAKLEAHVAELAKISGEIEALQDQEELSRPQSRLVPPAPIYNGPGSSVPRAPAQPRLVQGIGGMNRRFNDMFSSRGQHDPYAGRFTDLGEFGRAVAGGADGRLIRNVTYDGMNESTGSQGGYLVPRQWMGEIFDQALEQEVIRPAATVLPMTSNELIVGDFNYSDGTNGTRAGLRLDWVGEETQLLKQYAAAREFQLAARKGSIFVKVTNELAGDAPNFDMQLRAAMVQAVAAGLDLAFIAGTGAGQPLGLINAVNKISVAKEGSQVAATIVLANLAKMLGRFTPGSYRKAKWLVHPTCLPQLYQMTVTIRNVAATENVGGGSAGVVQNADGSLSIFGIPVIVTEMCSPLGTEGDIMLVDLTKYVIGMRQDAYIMKSDQFYFDEDCLAFRLVLRLDGQPLPHAVYTMRDGTNTVSPIVSLATRS